MCEKPPGDNRTIYTLENNGDMCKENRSVGYKCLNLHCLQPENVKMGKQFYCDNDSLIALKLFDLCGEDMKQV